MTAPEDPRPQAREVDDEEQPVASRQPGGETTAPDAEQRARRVGAPSEPLAEVSEDAGDEPFDQTSEDPGDEPVRRRRGRRIGRWLVAAALVLLTAAAGFLLYQVRSAQLDEQARQQALTAARQSAINISSISTNDFAAGVARVLDGATGQFRQDFSARTGELQQLLKDNNVSAQGNVLEAGLVRSDRRSATALVAVDSTVKNKQVPTGRVNNYRMKLQLEKVGDHWLTSSLEFVA